MNLQFLRSGESVSATEAAARGVDVLVAPVSESLPSRHPGSTLMVSVDASSPGAGVACKSAAGTDSVIDDPLSLSRPASQHLVACPNANAEEQALDRRVQEAAKLPVDGVLLDAPDAWYAAGRRGASFCEYCEARLGSMLATIYAEQYAASPVLAALAAASDEKDAPFWREHELLRLRAGVEHGARLTRRVRDEVRLTRNSETQVGARVLGVSPAAIALARKLDFLVVPAPVPVPERSRVATYELFRAALDQRPLVGLLDANTAGRAALVKQAARLASAIGAEVTLPADAPPESHDALAAHSKFWHEFRSHYRPIERVGDVLLLYSPECDHWTHGRHGGGVRALAEALTRIGAQYRIVLSIPRVGTEPVVLADAAALPEEEAARLERRITEGASAIVIGSTGAADDEGRPLESPLPDLSTGLNKVGAGTVFVVDLQPSAANAPERRWEPLVTGLDKGLESLLGRGRRAVVVSKPSMVVKMYLDPERKLDVHLVGRQFDPATGAPEECKGVTLHLAGSAVSGARTGYLFSPDAPERKVSLSPFGMGVQATLPDFVGSAVLTISR